MRPSRATKVNKCHILAYYNFCHHRSKRATGKVIDVADVSLDNALSDYNEFGLNFKVNLNLSRLDNQNENELGNEYDAYAEYFNRNFQYDQQLVEDIVTRAPKKTGPIAARTMRVITKLA